MFRKIHVCAIALLKLSFLRRGLRVPAFILLGVFCGTGLLLAHIARVTSYLDDAPETCMNCHVMTDSYVSHRNSSHGRDLTCVDCHLPHTSMAREYMFKAVDGLKHACAFTLHTESQTMKLSAFATPVVQENCMRCHEGRMSEVSAAYETSGMKCWDCHKDVVHGHVQSLSASPGISRPRLPSVTEIPAIPNGITKLLGKGQEKYEEVDWGRMINAIPE